MKDFRGQEISIGDAVIMIRRGYREFESGKVIKLTDARIEVEYIGTYRFNKETTHRRPEDLIIVEPLQYDIRSIDNNGKITYYGTQIGTTFKEACRFQFNNYQGFDEKKLQLDGCRLVQ